MWDSKMDICVAGSVKHPWVAASQLAPRLFDANPKTLRKVRDCLQFQSWFGFGLSALS